MAMLLDVLQKLRGIEVWITVRFHAGPGILLHTQMANTVVQGCPIGVLRSVLIFVSS